MSEIYMLDVDGTVTESAQRISADMAAALGQFDGALAFISGTDLDELKRMLAPLRTRRSFYMLPEMGVSCHHSDGILQYDMGTPFPRDMVMELSRVYSEITTPMGIEPLAADVVLVRDYQITFSMLGRSAPLETKKAFDPDQSIRQEVMRQLQERFPDIHITIGGTTSLDIQWALWDKYWGVSKFLSWSGYDKGRVVYFGDQLEEGNDRPVRDTGVNWIEVSGPEETLEYLTGANGDVRFAAQTG